MVHYPLVYYPLVVIISAIVGISCFIAGGIFVNRIYDHRTDPSLEKVVSGCIITYSMTTPSRSDVLNRYYSGSSVADSTINCLGESSVQAYNINDNSAIPSAIVRSFLMGCIGHEVMDNWFSKPNVSEVIDCLNKNHLYFRIKQPTTDSTPGITGGG